MTKYKLTRKGFSRWLEANSTMYVGAPKCVGDCPLARYLHFLGDYSHVTTFTRYTTNPFKKVRLPLWAHTFVKHIDGFYTANARLSGNEALQVLNNVP